MDYFLRPFNELVLKKSNFNVDVKERLTDRDLIVLIAMTCAESFYKRPALCILDQSSSLGALYSTTFRSLTTYPALDAIRKRIRVMEGHIHRENSWTLESADLDQIQAFEDLFAELFRDFMHGNTILSLDDDKLRKLSALFARMGLKKVFTRESGACPVMHMVCSLLTGLIFCRRLDRPGTPLCVPCPPGLSRLVHIDSYTCLHTRRILSFLLPKYL